MPDRERWGGLRWFPICEPCVRGEGEECHTPECALFLRDVPKDGLIAAFGMPYIDDAPPT